MNNSSKETRDSDLAYLMQHRERVRMNDMHMTDDERRRGRERLEQAMHQSTGKKHVWTWTAAAAACVAILLASVITVRSLSQKDDHQMVINPQLEDIVLTQGGKTVSLDDRAVLTIGSDGTLNVQGTDIHEDMGRDEMLCLTVPDGRHTQVTLSDGSMVWINSGSTVSFPAVMKTDCRELTVDGEVYLEVAHNESAVFVVHADGFDVQVLGTKFGLLSRSGEKERYVVLAEGKVSAKCQNGEAHTLSPGQMLSTSGSNWKVREVDPLTFISWKDDVMYFTGETIEEALRRLEHQYGVSIDCTTSVARDNLYGKLLLEDDIESVLDNLEVIAKLHHTVKEGKIIMY